MVDTGTGSGAGPGAGTGAGISTGNVGVIGGGHGAALGIAFSFGSGMSRICHRGCSTVASRLEWRPGSTATASGILPCICKSCPRRPFLALTLL